MVVLIAHVYVRQGHRDTALDLCQGMLAPSRAEEGCITYAFYEDPHDLGHITFVEEWESREALFDIHFQTDHFKAFQASLTPYLASAPEITVYDVAGITKVGE